MGPSRRPDRHRELPARNARRRRRSGRRRSAVGLVLALALALSALGAAAVATGVYAFGDLCNLSVLRPVNIGQNTFVYAADGSLLGSIPAERNREVVPLREISPWVPRATVAIEDRRFYEHSGVDVEGIARALWANVQAGEVVQGGSTITQQVVRTLYISNERTVKRKAREACLALKLADAWSRERILGTYLNSVYYGNQAYGVEAAAQTYYSKTARDLGLAEAALLAGLTQAPSAFDPLVQPARAIARRNEVLDAMLENGDITRAQRDRIVARRDLGLRPGRLYREIREPYFFGYVRDQLIERYGAEVVRTGGLRVHTTIDPRYQRLARDAITSTLTYPDDPAAAIVSINPANGAIKAMTAVTPGRARNEFNLLSQARRQTGSTFKTFVLATAVARGIDPASTYYVSAPFTYRPREDGSCEDETWWCVKTYDSSYTGWTSIARATLRSDNAVYAQLTVDLGPEAIAETAARMGIRSPLDVNGVYVPAMGLGSIAVSPLDIASAYATLAAAGMHTEPRAIRKVVFPSGREDPAWSTPRRVRALPAGVAYVVTKILEENMLYGTGTAAYFGRPAAGKTGTTDRHADAWFAGYTPELQTTVWMGYPRGEIPMENVHGISVSGGSFPAAIWRAFMEPALSASPIRDFEEPSSLPDWQPFERGPHALSFDPYYVPPETEETDSEETDADPDAEREQGTTTDPQQVPGTRDG